MSTHEINAQARASRKLPRLVPGAKMWNVPCRWWEPEDYPPEMVTVVKADSGPMWALCHYPGAEFSSYLFHADLCHTEREARDEMAKRTTAMDAEREAQVDEVLRRALAGENWIDVMLEVTE